MIKEKICTTTLEICIKKIIVFGYTWEELEEYLNINCRLMQKELREFLKNDAQDKMKLVINIAEKNRRRKEVAKRKLSKIVNSLGIDCSDLRYSEEAATYMNEIFIEKMPLDILENSYAQSKENMYCSIEGLFYDKEKKIKLLEAVDRQLIENNKKMNKFERVKRESA